MLLKTDWKHTPRALSKSPPRKIYPDADCQRDCPALNNPPSKPERLISSYILLYLTDTGSCIDTIGHEGSTQPGGRRTSAWAYRQVRDRTALVVTVLGVALQSRDGGVKLLFGQGNPAGPACLPPGSLPILRCLQCLQCLHYIVPVCPGIVDGMGWDALHLPICICTKYTHTLVLIMYVCMYACK